MTTLIDRTGERYGNLLVIERAQSVASGSAWRCKCDCGDVVTVAASNLKKGQTCCKECSNERRREDLKGKRYGRLTVTEFSRSVLSKPYWLCRCDCGSTTEVMAQSLTTGNTRSCGCFASDRASERFKTHGLTEHPLYDAWVNMRQRCLNPKHKWFHRYGARGITICERWNDFQAFYDDMIPTWKKGLTLERVEVNGPYSKENCEWIIQKLQMQNLEKTIRVEVKGRLMTLPEIAERYNLNQHTLWYRWKAGKTGDDFVKPAMKMKGRN